MEPCLNCGEDMQSKYCPNCGQKEGLSPRSVVAAFSDLIGNVFSYDNKVWRSLVLLCFRPGKLTKAFCKGQRSRYFDPLRMFLLMSALVFLAPDTISVGEYRLSEEWSQPAPEGYHFGERLRIGSERVKELAESDPESYIIFLNQVTKRYLVFSFIVGILSLTLFLRLIRFKSYLVEHFVFALHFCSFILIANLLLRLVMPNSGFTNVEAIFMTVVQVLYFPWAYLVVYSKPGKKNRIIAFLVSIVAMCVFFAPYMASAQLSIFYVLMPPAS